MTSSSKEYKDKVRRNREILEQEKAKMDNIKSNIDNKRCGYCNARGSVECDCIGGCGSNATI